MSNIEDEEIDLAELGKTILRRRNYILKITSLSIFIGVLYLFNTKPVWEGFFQIVISQPSKNNVSQGSLNSLLGSQGLNDSFGIKNELATEVLILKSPSVLKPIYDFVKLKKKSLGEDTSKWRFYPWRKNNVDIKINKGTSVLDINYRDTNKEFIIPVLEKISKTYQDYSKAERSLGIKESISYLENQIIEMENKSTNSLIDLQKFSLENGYRVVGTRSSIPIAFDSLRLPSLDDPSLNTNRLSINNSKTINYGVNEGNTYENTYNDQFERLSALEAELVAKSIIFSPNSNYIINLKNKISSLKLALTKSPEILLKFRQLKNNAMRDEQMFFQLKSNLSALKLQEARQLNPWELISKPFLKRKPFSPNKIRVLSLSLLFGIGFGTLSAVLLENKIGKIYGVKSYKRKISYPLLKTLSTSSNNLDNSINLLFRSLRENLTGSIGLIPIGRDFNQNDIRTLKESLNKSISKDDYIFTTNLYNPSKCTNLLLIVAPGACTYNHLSQIKEDLLIQQLPILGWIYLTA